MGLPPPLQETESDWGLVTTGLGRPRDGVSGPAQSAWWAGALRVWGGRCRVGENCDMLSELGSGLLPRPPGPRSDL